jgi:hypothetical protein
VWMVARGVLRMELVTFGDARRKGLGGADALVDSMVYFVCSRYRSSLLHATLMTIHTFEHVIINQRHNLLASSSQLVLLKNLRLVEQQGNTPSAHSAVTL